MRHRNSVFRQLTKHIPWSVFDDAVSKHDSHWRVRRLRTREQLLYGHSSRVAASLRESEYMLASQEAQLYRAGLRGISRLNFPDADAKRPFEACADV